VFEYSDSWSPSLCIKLPWQPLERANDADIKLDSNLLLCLEILRTARVCPWSLLKPSRSSQSFCNRLYNVDMNSLMVQPSLYNCWYYIRVELHAHTNIKKRDTYTVSGATVWSTTYHRHTKYSQVLSQWTPRRVRENKWENFRWHKRAHKKRTIKICNLLGISFWKTESFCCIIHSYY
jgi:hypothetical protein